MNNKIPSDDDFARASAASRISLRGLGEVHDRIVARFRSTGEIYAFSILDCSETSFRAIIFYRLNVDIDAARKSGLEARIKTAVYEELENVGRGDRSTVDVIFEFDSDENVKENYEGNYYYRLC